MNSKILKLILLSSILLQTGCDITFKKKTTSDEAHKSDSVKANSKYKAVNKDTHIINTFYSDEANAVIRKDMISHTAVSKKQEKKLVVGKTIPRDIQVMPLPLELEKRLSALSLNTLRVQVGTRIILMDVKSRQILVVIKI